MKYTIQHHAILIFVVILGLFYIGGCSDAKQAQNGYDKFIRNGGKFECEPTIITIHDTIKGKDGKDSIVEKLVKVPCPKVETPKTRYEIRFDNKRFDDSLDFIKSKYKDSLRYALKSKKTDSKTQVKLSGEQTKQVQLHTKGIVKTAFPWEWLFGLIALAIGAVIFLIHKFKK